MDTEAGTEDHPKDEIDDGGWNWTMEKEVGKPFRPYLCQNDIHDANCRSDTKCSDDVKDTKAPIQDDAMSVNSSTPDTSSVPASDGEQATLENDPAHTSTDAWHLATYMTANGEKSLWCVGAPAETREKDYITLVVNVDETKKHYTITPYFPASNKSSAVLWADPAVVSNALAEIKTILTKIDPSVCFDVKTKALESNDRETRALWHVAALNTMKARSQDRVNISLGEYPVSFGRASENYSIVPGTYYPNREDIIRPQEARHVLRTDQAKRFFAQLPPSHPLYRPLKSKGTAQK